MLLHIANAIANLQTELQKLTGKLNKFFMRDLRWK